MRMEIETIGILLAAVIALLVIQVAGVFLIQKQIKGALKKIQAYVTYILDDTNEESDTINIEETEKRQMNERQKELLLQEMLEGFLA